MACFSYTCQLDLFLKYRWPEASVYFSAVSTHRRIEQASGMRPAEAVTEVTMVFVVSLT